MNADPAEPVLTLRDETAEDAAATAALEPSGLPEALRGDPVLAPLAHAQRRARAALMRTAFPTAKRRVVERQGVIMGLLITADETDRIHVVEIAVEGEYRRQGVGTWMLDQVLEHARTTRRSVTARIFQDNHASLRLFAGRGFALTLANGAAQIEAIFTNQ